LTACGRTWSASCRGFQARKSRWATPEALAALTEGCGREALRVGSGISIPVAAEWATRFPDVDVLIAAVKDPGSCARCPNESRCVPTLQRAIVSHATLLSRLNASVGQPDLNNESLVLQTKEAPDV